METIAVRCSHCGAPLDVGAQARFVTCRYCNHQLEVVNSESAVYTQGIERIARSTEQIADSLELIQLQNELERLDRERGAPDATDGESSGAIPSEGAVGTGAGLFGALFAIFFALVCFAMAATVRSWGFPPLFAWVPAGMGAFGLLMAMKSASQTRRLARSDAEYQRRRAELLKKIQAQRAREQAPGH